MRVEDLAAVLEIERQSFTDGPLWSRATFRDELDLMPEQREYLVVEDCHAVIGYGGLALGVEQADLLTLAVHPSHRREGVGGVLLRDLLQRAAGRRLVEVLLEVRADNLAALALYRRAGFTLVSRRRRYYAQGVDALVLGRRLGRVDRRDDAEA